MSIFQIIAVLFALFMVYVTRVHKRQLSFSLAETLFWYTLWGVFIIIAIFPNSLLGVVDLLHFARVFDLLIVGALMILTIVTILTNFNQRADNKKIEKFVREHAIKNVHKKSK